MRIRKTGIDIWGRGRNVKMEIEVVLVSLG